MAPRRHTGEHALDGELAEQVPIVEGVVGVEVDLAAGGLGGPRPTHGHGASAEHDRARCRPVARRGAIGIVVALGPDLVGQLFFHDLADNDETGRAAERHEAVLDGARQVLEGDGRLGRQLSEARRLVPLRDSHNR